MAASNIQVAIKVRPILGNEKESFWRVAGNSIQLIVGQHEPFYFDHIFDQNVSNQVIFDTMAKQIVDSGIKGFNGTIFAYGQTSSGKTYTMMGEKTNPGVMELATNEIFKEIEKASDRQFLLRVGYIEIYNEKIYDLLNYERKHQDLKIHETPNGDVSVNCSEHIITSKEDLLSHLRIGSKQRKQGETNMNERSSRSHAIFRIIIESRKTDLHNDDDSVQISILNLVDLAGSERADQTGATGSRLKEGNHINKSLHFLSRVIKQLAEEKYVSYRDSKLTRILQASLGGNALTAIICNVNPNAVDETLSTLSFAYRAKVIKNKPQVNEVLSDAAMMKKLEKEINRLQNELEVEKTKNSQIKVGQLQKRINDEHLKIINSNSTYSSKVATEKRRRTWCPSSHTPPLVEINAEKSDVSKPPTSSHMPTKLQLPKSVMNFTPHITLRDVYYQDQFKEMQCSPSIDEEFIPAEEACFDEVLTPRTSPKHLNPLGFQTPTQVLKLRTTSLTPRLTEKESLQKLEQELKDLQVFTNLENKLNVEHDTYNTLKYKLENAEQVIARYEKEREDFAFVRAEYLECEGNLADCRKRCQELESNVTELQSNVNDLQSNISVLQSKVDTQASEFAKASQDSAELVVRHEKEISELKATITQLEMENREAVSLEFEFQQHRNKSKRRETELLYALDEKQKEIKRLEQSLQTITNETLNNSKEELRQLSKDLDDTETVCVKCKDLNQLLEDNKSLTQNFEKVQLDYQALQLNLEKTSAEAESDKLRADSLETENDSLKKDTALLKTLHGSLEELQNQIASLQVEKCKLDSVKIEFEVMSKETAGKIAEKINITQEIQTLVAQRDNLAAECDKLLLVIADNNNVTEELNNLRTENVSLHSELQVIKTKLETVQSDYDSLMTDNQSKTDNYERLNMEVLSARHQLQILQSEYHHIQQQYEQIQAECNKHEGTIGEIQCEYDLIQKKYQGLQREYEKLENDSVQSIADCDRVQNQNETLETEIRELKTKVEEAQRKLLENDSLQMELESLKSEMNRLQVEYEKDLSIKRKSASPSKENGVDVREENAQLKHDLENLQAQFNEMQKEYDDISTQLVDNFADYETLQEEMAKMENELKRYKESEEAEIFQAMQTKLEKLQADNEHLKKENAEWTQTVSFMTESMREKCDESMKLTAELEETKGNASRRSESPRKSLEQFVQLADSFVEIEIPAVNGGTRTFQAPEAAKSTPGSKMIIGNISGITRGQFNALRGAIEFAIDPKTTNEIYDSLEVDRHLARAQSCDSLEGVCKPTTDSQINELVEEKTQLLGKIHDLEEESEALRVDNALLNDEKINLIAICDENKCKIEELTEVVSCTKCENNKLIADCEQLKKTVDLEEKRRVESVPREIYEELQSQTGEYEEKCAELREQLMALQSKLGNDSIVESVRPELCKCEDYKREIAKIEEMANVLSHQLKLKDDLPSVSELEHTITQLHEKLQACKCVELRAALEERTRAELSDDKTAKYEQDICELLEQLKRQEGKCQKVQVEIIELKTSLEEKTKESTECVTKFESLNGRFLELGTEHNDLQSEICLEREKTDQLEKSLLNLKNMEEECNLLQNSVACLSQTIASLSDERNEIANQKEALEKEHSVLREKLLCIEEESRLLKSSKGELSELSEVLKILKAENAKMLEEKLNFKEQCESHSHSEKKLHEQLQKLVEEQELIVRENARLVKECNQSNNELEQLKSEYEINCREKRDIQMKCDELADQLSQVSEKKKRLESELEEAKEQHEHLKECFKEERSNLEDQCSTLASEIVILTTTKSELQSALDKAKTDSQFLLQQGKDLEEQLNMELCTVRNSNNTLTQQIDDLYEKLENAKDELEVARKCSNKDELISQLTDNKKSLTTKNSELEKKLELLSQDLEQSHHLNRVFEKGISEKDELITQLSTKSAECEDTIDLLKKSLEEASGLRVALEISSSEKEQVIAEMTKKCSLMEDRIELLKKESIELRHVLEASSSEKDEMIEQLSMKCSEMEEKVELLTTEASDLRLVMETSSSEKDQMIEKMNLKCSEMKAMEELLMQQIEESKQCLAKDTSEKDQMIAQMLTKCSDLEEKLAFSEKELEKSRQCLSEEIHRKDESIAQLTAKVKELEGCISLLKEELDESKRSLLNEKHLKEVLEKANAERDDLIVQLTNNNNALATKSSELEGKLAILNNQFEESKRHLSNEVARLKQLLTEATQLNTSQSSKIEDLTSKIQTLEGDLNRAQNAAAEQEKLLKKLNQLQAEYDALSEKYANLELHRSSFEAELNAARVVVVENAALTKKIDEMQLSLKEMHLKCNSLSADNQRIEASNLAIAKQLDDALQQAKDSNRLDSEVIGNLRAQLEKAHKAQSAYEANQRQWECNELTFVENISKLQATIAGLISENKTMQHAEKINQSKITHLEQQINSLQKENSVSLSKTISPRREKAIDNLMGENHQLKVKNMNLMEKLDSCHKSQNEERKNRRLSTHDERRRQSFWDSNRDVSTMTEPTSSECNCYELDLKLNELKQRLLIRDSQVNTLSMELKNHPLKMENATLKKLLNDEESKQHKLRQELKKYQQLIVSRTNESRHCAKCAEASKKIFLDSSVQTVDRDETECYRKLLSKYEDLKMICRVRHTKIKELEDALSTGKENANDNVSAHNNQQYRQKYELLKKELKVLQEKYEEAKLLCNMRYEQIKKISNSQSSGSS